MMAPAKTKDRRLSGENAHVNFRGAVRLPDSGMRVTLRADIKRHRSTYL
jgi:hypothetical protein